MTGLHPLAPREHVKQHFARHGAVLSHEPQLDRATGAIDKVPFPDIDLPRGGLFAGLKLPIGVFTGKHGPHSMAETSDGRIWKVELRGRRWTWSESRHLPVSANSQ